MAKIPQHLRLEDVVLVPLQLLPDGTGIRNTTNEKATIFNISPKNIPLELQRQMINMYLLAPFNSKIPQSEQYRIIANYLEEFREGFQILQDLNEVSSTELLPPVHTYVLPTQAKAELSSHM